MLGQQKPSWIRAKLPGGKTYQRVLRLLGETRLTTVCEQARCPNLGECWGSGTATIMLLGDICTRGCRFCAVSSGTPTEANFDEPQRVAQTVKQMGLSYIVLTMVNRDDLADGGAALVAKTIRHIRELSPSILIEVLVSDFMGNINSLHTILEATPEVFGHNLETVSSLTPMVRDRRASYQLSLQVLHNAKIYRPNQLSKSSLMVGLGETESEIFQTMDDLRKAQVNILTLGQYLQPTARHLPVQSFIHPDTFERWRQKALSLGFKYVAAGPMVRSSYKAGEDFVHFMLQHKPPAAGQNILTLPQAKPAN